MSHRFCNPLETSVSSLTDSQPLRDFEFARQELAAKQNARYVQLSFDCLLMLELLLLKMKLSLIKTAVLTNFLKICNRIKMKLYMRVRVFRKKFFPANNMHRG